MLVSRLAGVNWPYELTINSPRPDLWPQALIPTYQNLSPIAQEISSGEMSEVTKKSDNSLSQMRLLRGLLIWGMVSQTQSEWQKQNYKLTNIYIMTL